MGETLMGETLGRGERTRARNMRKRGLSWNEVARQLEVSVERLRRAIDPGYAKRRQLSAKAHRVARRGKPHSDDHATYEATRKMAEFLFSKIPPDTRGVTARLMGDPLPGRSALDRRAK